MTTLRVAVVGAGPAGAYAAGELLRSGRDIEVDLFDRLPTPWGLLRAGVAPDHQEIKGLARRFENDLMRSGSRFFGGVEVGRELTHEELAAHYSAIVYAVGAQADRTLGIPGEDLPGSLPATAFVAWYNGHPDHRGLAPDFSAERAVIIGNGNVAADVARILVRSPDELARTDIADHALDALRESRIREVVVVGRRGPAQAAFTSSELRELGHLDGVDVAVDPAEVELDDASREWLEAEGGFTARTNMRILRALAEREPWRAPRRLVLRFLRSPVAVRGDGRVEAVELAVNELMRDERGAIGARPTDQLETVKCGLLLRSVGYRSVPLEGVPFDARRCVLPNERGRVTPGVYAVGWAKRGSTGILGTNKRDAEETVATLLEDLDAGRLRRARSAGEANALIARACPGPVTFAGWRAIDEQEVARGQAEDRPRVKLCSVEELHLASRAESRTLCVDRTSAQGAQ